MGSETFNVWPAWLRPGGAGFTGTLLALAPAEYQTADYATYFINGRVISAPKMTADTDVLDYFYKEIFKFVDVATRRDIKTIYPFFQSVKEGKALILSASTPRPEVQQTGGQSGGQDTTGEQHTGGLFGSDAASHANVTPIYGPVPGVPFGIANQILTREECEQFYASNPVLVKPPNYPVD